MIREVIHNPCLMASEHVSHICVHTSGDIPLLHNIQWWKAGPVGGGGGGGGGG